jgi:hypothetical protein
MFRMIGRIRIFFLNGHSACCLCLAAPAEPLVTSLALTVDGQKHKLRHTALSESKSPVVSPCLSPAGSASASTNTSGTEEVAAMADVIEYLDLNDGEMHKWPGVDPESRYDTNRLSTTLTWS